MKKQIIALASAVLLANPIESTASDLDFYEAICEDIADMYCISPELLEAIIFYESSSNPKAVSSCGAIGLTQIRPEMHGDRMDQLGVTDLYDPYQNILTCADYLYELSKEYEAYEALVAYNCGEYSDELKDVLEGGSNVYAEQILTMSAELEKAHGK